MPPTRRRSRPRLAWAAALSAAGVVSMTLVAQASQGSAAAPGADAPVYTLTSACRGSNVTAPAAQSAAVRVARADQAAPAQRWHVSATDGGWSVVASAVDGRVLDVAGEATTAGTPVIAWAWHEGANQQFRLADAGDGTSTLEARNAPGQVLGLGRGRTVRLAPAAAGCATRWRVTKVDDAPPAPAPSTPTTSPSGSSTPSVPSVPSTSPSTPADPSTPPTSSAPPSSAPTTAPSTTAPPAPTASAPAFDPAPVLDRDFADPDVVKAGDTYHAYATNSDGKHILQATSRDLATWSYAQGDALPKLGDWADPGCGGCVWAPDVSAVGSGFVMYYVARDRASNKQCIGAATSASADGPFAPAGSGPLVCTPDQGGSIDPSSFVDGGHRYVVWKNDGNCCAMDTWLHLQEVSADGLTVTGGDTRLVKQDRPFEGALVEAPVLWKHGGTYVLLYSANNYADDSYATGYATSASITGPYTKGAPIMTTDLFEGAIHGPGGEDVVAGPDGADRIVFHGWDAAHRYRALYVEPLTWDGDTPVVAGTR